MLEYEALNTHSIQDPTMNQSLKAVLISAFIFPGAGHFFLKRLLTGTILAATSCISLYLILTEVVERAIQVTDMLQQGTLPLDRATLTQMLSQQPPGANSHYASIASTLLTITWLIGIIDSYRLGRHKQAPR